MALPIMFFNNSNNHRNNNNGGEVVRNGGFTITSTTTTNRSLTLFPSLTNGGEAAMNNGGFTINTTTRGLSLFPSLTNNGVFSNHSINHGGNRNLSVLPSFDGVSSPNYYNPRNTSLSLMLPGFNNGGETMINNGVSYNSLNNHQNLGFSVSSGNGSCFHGVSSHYSVSSSTTINHRTRNLSFGPRFNTAAESVTNITGGIRRRTVLRNQYYASSSSSPLATSEMLRARLISALSTRNRMHHHTPQFHSQNVISPQPQRGSTLTITELDDEALAPSPLNVYYPPPPPPPRNNDDGGDHGGDGGGDNGVDGEGGDDGVTHSLPCQKYGPYTCPRCFGKFQTSQMFAAHVSSHYKHETRAQRRRRLMARLKTRNLRFKRSGEGITLVPEKKVAETKEEPVAEAEANGGGGSMANVQVKEENAD